MKRIRPVTVLFLALILVLGYSLVIRQRREARLRAALALYKGRATGEIAGLMEPIDPLDRPDWPKDTPLAEVIGRIKNARPPGVSRRAPHPRRPGRAPGGRAVAGLADGGAAARRRSPAAAPLGEKLRILLEPLGLAAEVKDGAIVITSRARAEASTGMDEEK